MGGGRERGGKRREERRGEKIPSQTFAPPPPQLEPQTLIARQGDLPLIGLGQEKFTS